MGLPARLVPSSSEDYFSPEEYLAWEETQPIRHEYVDGQVYARTGVSKNHARITKNISFQLERQLFDNVCEPYVTDVKVEVKTYHTRYYYPDVIVTCESGNEDPEDPYIAGLLEYVIVAQDQMRVEVYRHEKAGDVWQREVCTEPEQEVTFQSVGLSFSLATIYHRVVFPPLPEGEFNL
jgi:Uma2 family endonuclease